MPLDKQSGVNAILVAQPCKHGSTASGICFHILESIELAALMDACYKGRTIVHGKVWAENSERQHGRGGLLLDSYEKSTETSQTSPTKLLTKLIALMVSYPRCGFGMQTVQMERCRSLFPHSF